MLKNYINLSMLWLLAQQCVETWQIFRNFNLFLVISFEKENIIKNII
jgi:hypothetical protein